MRLPANGPEDVVVDRQGDLLTGVADGRILRVDPDSGRNSVVADTGGRPLGMHLMGDDELLVCDAEQGLLHLDLRTGGLRTLHAVPFASNAVADPDGTIYFTQSSRRFGLAHWQGDILEHSGTGRLLRLSPDGQVDVLLDDLQFANGVVRIADAAVVAETGAYRLTRLFLSGHRAGQREMWVPNLPGSPDNLAMGPDGTLWAALANPRDRLLDLALRCPPIVRKAIWALPDRLLPGPRRTVRLVGVDGDGRISHDLCGRIDGFRMATGVASYGGHLYVGSLVSSAIAVLEAPPNRPQTVR
ncbi:SMP-30/gluconolactonase/LRE family protein [Actinoallomurus acaciae]|uniref:SMP-30/gluconolactonase/LRE family protein n=1 Tax=Actinoallomurus acaciae TaxID=502577 RepID=A0ABV5YAG5_9ACTN